MHPERLGCVGQIGPSGRDGLSARLVRECPPFSVWLPGGGVILV